MNFFNLKDDDEFIQHRIDRYAVSDGWIMAYLMYWR